MIKSVVWAWSVSWFHSLGLPLGLLPSCMTLGLCFLSFFFFQEKQHLCDMTIVKIKWGITCKTSRRWYVRRPDISPVLGRLLIIAFLLEINPTYSDLFLSMELTFSRVSRTKLWGGLLIFSSCLSHRTNQSLSPRGSSTLTSFLTFSYRSWSQFSLISIFLFSFILHTSSLFMF